MKDRIQEPERHEDEIERGAGEAQGLAGIQIRLPDVVKRACRVELGGEQVMLRILRQGFDFARVEVEPLDGERALRDGESVLIAADSSGLKHEFVGRIGQPMGSIVDGVALRDFGELRSVSAHDRDAGVSALARQGTGNAIGVTVQAADTEVGGVQEALLLSGSFIKAEDAGNFLRVEGIDELIRRIAVRDASDRDREGCRIMLGRAPEQASGHEASAAALGLPGVTVVDLDRAIANRVAELALYQTHFAISIFEMELSLGEVSEVNTHQPFGVPCKD